MQNPVSFKHFEVWRSGRRKMEECEEKGGTLDWLM